MHEFVGEHGSAFTSAEAGGEAIKQGGVMLSSPDRALDTEALKEAFVGGAAAGADPRGDARGDPAAAVDRA